MDMYVWMLAILALAGTAALALNQYQLIRWLERRCDRLESTSNEHQSIVEMNSTIEELIDNTKTIRHPEMIQRRAMRHLAISPGYVYLMCMNGEYYKIGYTQDVRRRLSSIQHATPYKVEVLHMIATHHAPRLEVVVQNQYAEKWVSGEWFKLDTDDVVSILSIKSPVTIADLDRMEQP